MLNSEALCSVVGWGGGEARPNTAYRHLYDVLANTELEGQESDPWLPKAGSKGRKLMQEGIREVCAVLEIF